ncbi:hypothetical protein GJU39_21305 [Pedobacter petrophilus]|uniref:YD repeat-containing protein n=1 Tax=Pedobacter petrophilus TaxID=1908241 RepID=A0A7K0G4Q4_9SPHI|nr:hypothetical protein [Pedobacter petrophilus]MRX78622.1 hypothetical protein [Pedobacter petrophilus]
MCSFISNCLLKKDTYGIKSGPILILLISLNLSAVSQGIKSIIPPSPTAREFDKYINYEVSLQNGLPDITIPLYNIKVGKNVIPLELKYHASGIKFGQTNGDVGVGWILQPGHRVSRTIYGRPDEYFDKAIIPSHFENNWKRDEFFSQLITDGGIGMPAASKYLDGEADLFTYSTPSQSGSFLIEDRYLKKIRQISHSNLSIDYNQATDRKIDFFDIKDGDGVSYRFGKNLHGGSIFVENNSVNNNGTLAYSSWLLTDMVDLFGNYASFNYGAYQDNEYNPHSTLTIQQGGDISVIETEMTNIHFEQGNTTSTTPDVKRISSISTGQENILFYRSAPMGMIDSILVKTNQGDQIKKISFQYTTGTAHIFLDEIIISGSKNSDVQKYAFDYQKKNIAVSFNELKRDYWGYYLIRGSSGGATFPDFGTVTYQQKEGGSWVTRNAANDGLYTSDWNADLYTTPDYFTLKKVVYPTGGSTEYEYEGGKYGLNKIAGIRIKSIKSNDNINGETLINQYTYGLDASGYGEVAQDLANSDHFINESLYLRLQPGTSDYIAFSKKVYSMNLPAELAMGAYIGSPVYYQYVTQYSSKTAAGISAPSETNGKVEYVFSRPNEYSLTGFSTNPNYYIKEASNPNSFISRRYSTLYISNFRPWDKSVILSKSEYSVVNNIYHLKQKEDFDYENHGFGTIEGYKVRPFANLGSNYSNSNNYYASGINSIFDFSPYYIQFGNKLLKKKIITRIFNNQALIDSSYYYYNNDYQISRTETWGSDQKTTVSSNTYAKDLGNINSADAFSLGLKNMQLKHLLNIPIETVTSIKPFGNANEFIKESVLYEFFSDKPNLHRIFKIESPSLLNNFSKIANLNGDVLIDTGYQPQIQFNDYTTTGNLLEQQMVKGPVSSYLYSYDSQYPVAEIKNANYSTIEAILGSATIASIASAIPTDAQIKEWIDILRDSPLLKDAQITSYTYKPLVGMTSMTDIKGMTTYYEYDEFQRLKNVKDQNGNILKSNAYHYKN